MRLPRVSLVTKIILLNIVAISAMGVFNAYRIYSKGTTIVYDLRKKSTISITNEKVARTNAIFDEAKNLANVLAKTNIVKSGLITPNKNRAELDAFVTQYKNEYKIIEAAYVLDKNGTAISASRPSFIGKDFSKRSYFSEALNGKSASGYYDGLYSGVSGYYFATPITDNNSIIGVSVVKILPEALNTILSNIPQTSDVSFMLTDKYGVITYSNIKSRMLSLLSPLDEKLLNKIESEKKYVINKKTVLDYDEVTKAINTNKNHEIITIFDKSDNRIETIFLNKIGEYPYYLLIEAENEDLMLQASQTAFSLVTNILFGIIISTLIVGVIIYFYIHPIDKFIKFSQKISSGDLDQKIIVNSNDEWSELADAFNLMIYKLKNYYQNLEETVKARTKELTDTLSEKESSKTALLNVLEDMEVEKKKVEDYANELKKFELAVSHANDHIVITDENGVVLFANKSVERITGYPIKDVLGKKAGSKEMWGGNESHSTYENFWKTIKQDKKQFVGQFNNKKKDGTPYIAEARVSPVLDKNNKVIFFVGIETDVTKAKEVDRMKTEFVSLASHQLRTPLAGMRWIIEMLIGGDVGTPNKEQSELLQNLLQTNERMTDLVDNLLNVSRIESGKITVEPTETNIQEAFSHVYGVLKFNIDRKKVDFSTDIDQSAQQVYIDPKLVKEILSNLMSNAIKYTPEGGKIKVTVKNTDNTLIITVSDNGYGIPEADQVKMFQKFYRAENVQRYVPEGTGLGLYVIKSIVEAMKGNITFESAENQGTTFTVKLPIKAKNSQLQR